MNLNKKVLMLLPCAALLLTSCNPWKGVDYETAKKFIDDNYKTESPEEKAPTKVHEKFKGTANNDPYSIGMLQFYAFEIFYNTGVPGTNIDWTKESPYTYEGDYTPVFGDILIAPIKSEYDTLENIDSLTPEDKANGKTCVYETNGKKFKQTINKKQERDASNYERTTGWKSYNDKGYRIEAYAKGEVKLNGEGMTISCSFEYSATYTYAE